MRVRLLTPRSVTTSISSSTMVIRATPCGSPPRALQELDLPRMHCPSQSMQPAAPRRSQLSTLQDGQPPSPWMTTSTPQREPGPRRRTTGASHNTTSRLTAHGDPSPPLMRAPPSQSSSTSTCSRSLLTRTNTTQTPTDTGPFCLRSRWSITTSTSSSTTEPTAIPSGSPRSPSLTSARPL